MRQLLLILALAFSLHAAHADSFIASGDDFYAVGAYENALAAYKKAYENAKKQGSYHRKFEALEKLVQTSKILGVSTGAYERELKSLNIPQFKNYTLRQNKLVVRFSAELKKDSYRSFRLGDDTFVLDVFSDFDGSTVKTSAPFASTLAIAKYRRALSRIVIKGQKNQDYRVAVWKNALIINTGREQNAGAVGAQNVSGQSAANTPNTQRMANAQTDEPLLKTNNEQILKRQDFIQVKPKKIIVLDPGHGGRDSGAVGVCGLMEKTLVLSVAKILKQELLRRNYKVFTTRDDDRFIELTDRTSYANKKNAHLFISIHGNSMPTPGKSSGVETYFLSAAKTQKARRVAEKENAVDLKAMEGVSKLAFLNFLNREKIVASNKLAIDLQKGILLSLRKNYTHIQDGGVREGPFWVLVGAQMPAVLVEVGFLSNHAECSRLKDATYNGVVAQGIADGIDTFFIHNKSF
ncbi:MAG: N-acetylmuramoyl-L-alanine amidase family protein [Helicobacteraceae bacterium]